MAEQHTEKRKLKKRFLVISGISKFCRAHGKILLLVVLIICMLALYFKPEPEPEPGFFDKLKQSTSSFWVEAKINVGKAWGGIAGFFGNIGVGITGGFAAIGDFFERLF